MPYTTTEIQSYRAALFPKYDNAGKISLYDTSNKNFATAFLRRETENLKKAYLDPNGIALLYFRRSVWSELMDLLRNEGPLYLHFWEGPGNNTHISTSQEPVAEGE